MWTGLSPDDFLKTSPLMSLAEMGHRAFSCWFSFCIAWLTSLPERIVQRTVTQRNGWKGLHTGSREAGSGVGCAAYRLCSWRQFISGKAGCRQRPKINNQGSVIKKPWYSDAPWIQAVSGESEEEVTRPCIPVQSPSQCMRHPPGSLHLRPAQWVLRRWLVHDGQLV